MTHVKKTFQSLSTLFIIEIIIGAFLSIFSFILFADITEDVASSEVLYIDHYLSNMVYSIRNPFLTDIMYFFSFLGGEFLLILGTLLVTYFLWKKHTKEAVFFVFVLTTGYILNLITKLIFQIPRPNIDPLYLITDYSYPSGHSMGSFIFYMTLAFLVYHFTKNKLISFLFFVLMTLIILCIGLSRVYLGVHYPSDVLGGYVAGFWWIVTAVILLRTHTFYKVYRDIKKNIKH